MMCRDCRYWSVHPTDAEVGDCRHAPPVLLVLPVQTMTGQGVSPVPMFPQTRAGIWCGKFSQRIDVSLINASVATASRVKADEFAVPDEPYQPDPDA